MLKYCLTYVVFFDFMLELVEDLDLFSGWFILWA